MEYLKVKTNLDYDIHVVQEVGISGSILAKFSDCFLHLPNGKKEHHETGANMANIFFFRSYKNSMFGYM
jgi:hypothetical protein